MLKLSIAQLTEWEMKSSPGIIISVQSGRSSLAKHGGAYFSAVYGFIKDPIAAPGSYGNQEC